MFKNNTICFISLALILILPTLLLQACGTGDDLIECESSTDYPGNVAEVINQYRQDNGLPEIPVSESLTAVAQKHVEDLENNNPVTGDCNLHSWSDKGEWTPCCYTDDHAEAQCMWDKPRELTSYVGNGYEISAQYSGKTRPNCALEQWRESEPHHDTILNRGIWADREWLAIGGAVSEHYAVVWFGTVIDNNELLVLNK